MFKGLFSSYKSQNVNKNLYASYIFVYLTAYLYKAQLILDYILHK